jgi:hypothetical protein
VPVPPFAASVQLPFWGPQSVPNFGNPVSGPGPFPPAPSLNQQSSAQPMYGPQPVTEPPAAPVAQPNLAHSAGARLQRAGLASPPTLSPTEQILLDHSSAIQALLQTLANKNENRVPKYRAPDSYDGNIKDYDTFVTRVKNAFKLDTTLDTDPKRIYWLATYLTGSALKWHTAVADAAGRNPPVAYTPTAQLILSDLAVFFQVFAQFRDPDPIGAAERKLASLRQTASAVDYANEFRTVIFNLELSEYSQVKNFYDGLKSDVKDIIAREGRPTTLEDIVQQAVRIDNNLYQRELEKRTAARVPSNANNNHARHDQNHQFARPRLPITYPNQPPQGPFRAPAYPPPVRNPLPAPRNSFPATPPTAFANSQPSRPRSVPAAVPMEIDSFGRYRVTQAEKNKRMANGECLRCGIKGHIAADHNNGRVDQNGRAIAAVQVETPQEQPEYDASSAAQDSQFSSQEADYGGATLYELPQQQEN